MKRALAVITLGVCLCAVAFGQSNNPIITPNIGLQIPQYGSTNWQVPFTYDMTLIDLLLAGIDPLPPGLIQFGSGAPTGACVNGTAYYNTAVSPYALWICNNHVWEPAGGGSGSMTWPVGGAGIPNYTGSDAWGSSYNSSNPIPANFLSQIPNAGLQNSTITIGSTTISLGQTVSALNGVIVDGVTPTIFGYVDPTSSIQTQLNGKQPVGSYALTSQLPNTIASVAHKYLTSYTASTETFTAAQPVSADLSDLGSPNGAAKLNGNGQVSLAELGSGTPAAGKYVDGASGVWTAIPSGVGISGTPVTGQIAQFTGSNSIQGITTVPVANGGLNTAVAPSSGQIPIGQSSTAYSPETVSGDGTINSSGVLTVTKSNGTPFGTAAFATLGYVGSDVPPLSGGLLPANIIPILNQNTTGNAGTATALATVPTDCGPGQYQFGIDVHGNALCTALPTQPGSQYIAPQAISGCGVQWVSGLTYTVGACVYVINGVEYNSPLSTITLPAADPTNPKIDAIFVDTSQVVQSLQGSPAPDPLQPTVDPAAELALTFVLVPASSASPANTTQVEIYLDDDDQWTPAVGGTSSASVNFNSTNNPYQGLQDTEFGTSGAVAQTTYVQYTDPGSATVTLSNYNAIVFYLRNKAAWPSTDSVTVQWYNGATPVGSGVVISNGAFGFNSTANTSTYQQIWIPLSNFATGSSPVTTVRFTVSGTGASLTGFYLDYVTLQGGVGSPILPSTLMNWQGTWSATQTYNPNDVVVSGGAGYVALAASTNQPVTNTAFWAALGNGATMVYPPAGVPNSTGTSWGTSYQVGNTGNDLVQLSGGFISSSIVPILNQNTTGNAGTATQLAAAPAQCPGGQFATGVQANGNSNCGTPTGAGTVNSGSAFSPAYYPSGGGTQVSGVVPFNGLAFFSTAAPPAAATGSQVVTVIGSNAVTEATNMAGGALGSLPYQTGVGATAFVAGNTAASDTVLTSTGTGSAAQAPTLKNAPALSAANMTSFPTLNQNTTGTAGGLSGTFAAHLFYASPSGGSGTASFRAIVASDVPTLNQNTTGTAANLSGTPALPNGTTATTQVTGDTSLDLATDAFVHNVVSANSYSLPQATTSILGGVIGDGSTITIASGVISCTIATTSQIGCVKPDGSTIVIAGGVISSAGSLTNPMTGVGDMIDGGTSGAATRVAAASGGTVPLTLVEIPGSQAQFALPGVPGRTVTTTTDTIALTDRSNAITYNSASSVAVTLTSAATLGSNFSFKAFNKAAGNVTFTPGAGTINGSSTLVLTEGQNCVISSPDNTNFIAGCSVGQISWGSGITATPTPYGVSVTASGSSGITGGTSGQVAIFGSATTIASGVALGNTGSDIPQLSGGLLSASIIPLATTGAFGAVKPDGSTIGITGGVISVIGGGGSVCGSSGQLQYNNSGSCGGTAGITYLGSAGFLAMASSESFTGGARFSQALVSNINSLNIATEQADQQGSSIVDGITGAVNGTSGTGVEEANGIDGIVVADFGFGSLGSGAGVGVRGQCRSTNNSLCWGAVFSSKGTSGLASQMQGVEIDLNVVNTGDQVIGESVQGGWGAIPTSAFGIVVNQPLGSSSYHWNTGFWADAGCCTTAIEIGPTASSGSSLASMPLVFDDVDSGSTQRQSTIKTTSAGIFVLTPFGAVTDIVGGLNVSTLAGGGTQCVEVDNLGNFAGTASGCGSGGGSVLLSPVATQNITGTSSSSVIPLEITWASSGTGQMFSLTGNGGATGGVFNCTGNGGSGGGTCYFSSTLKVTQTEIQDTSNPTSYISFGGGGDTYMSASTHAHILSPQYAWLQTGTTSSGSAQPFIIEAGQGSGDQGSTVALFESFTSGTIAGTGDVVSLQTTADNVADCPTSCMNAIGIWVNLGGQNTVQSTGKATVNLDASSTVAIGDQICTSATTAGTAHANGTTACTTQRIGFADQAGSSLTSITVYLRIQ